VKLHRLLAVAFVGIAAALGAATLIAQCLIPNATHVIDPSGISANGDNSFQIASMLKPKWPWLFEIRSDQAAYSRQSNLVISEDGKPLGPPHSAHFEVKEKGSGRYSHWVWPPGSMVIFSTSDNSDPRTNGRRYEIAARPVPFSLLTGCVLLLPLFLVTLQRLLFPQLDLTIGLVTGISVAALIAWGALFFDQLIVTWDSTTYVRWLPIVPLGYPLFLSGVKSVFRTLRYVGTIQVAFLVSACIFLAFSVKSVVRGSALQVTVLLLLLCYVPMFWYAGWLLSEALFIPLILLNVAAAFYLIAQQEMRYALTLAVTAALILFVRPAGYYAPIGIIFLMIALRGRARWMLKYACVPFALCIVATLLINLGIRGNGVPSQMGRVLFPTVSFLFEPQFVTGPYQEFVPAIEEVLKQRREGYTKTSSQAARNAYSLADYNSRLQAMDKALDEKCIASGTQCAFGMTEKVYLSFFISTIFNRPLGYANLVVAQIVEAWTRFVLARYDQFRNTYLDEARDLPTVLEQIQARGLPLTGEENPLRPSLLDAFPGRFVEPFDEGYQFISGQRWLIYLTGFVTLIAIPIAMFFRRDSIYWVSLGYCGVMTHGSILLTSLVTVFLHRYAMPVDPVILVSGAIMFGGFISWGLSRIRQIGALASDIGLVKWMPGV
jgi:hypothetical protein